MTMISLASARQPSNVVDMQVVSIPFRFDHAGLIEPDVRRRWSDDAEPQMVIEDRIDRRNAALIWTQMPSLYEGAKNLVRYLGPRLVYIDANKSTIAFATHLLQTAIRAFDATRHEQGRDAAEQAFLGIVNYGLSELKRHRICARPNMVLNSSDEGHYCWSMRTEPLEAWACRFVGWHFWVARSHHVDERSLQAECQSMIVQMFGPREAVLIQDCRG